MTNFSPTPTQSQVQVALGAFLLAILPAGVEVVAAQDNRVPVPKSPDYVTITATGRRRLATNVDTHDPLGQVTAVMQETEVAMQLDVHGPNSPENAQVITTLMRDEFATAFFDALGSGVSPLHADDPKQVPFILDAQQYEDRWVVQALLQADIVVSVPQQSAESVVAAVIDVDAAYPTP
jgi:hypothetical protein